MLSLARAIFFTVFAVTSGLIPELVPLPFDAWYVVSIGFFPAMFCLLAFFLWPEASFVDRVKLLAGALLLGYVAEEMVVILKSGVRMLSHLGPRLIILLIRFGVAFVPLAAAHLALRFLRKRKRALDADISL